MCNPISVLASPHYITYTHLFQETSMKIAVIYETSVKLVYAFHIIVIRIVSEDVRYIPFAGSPRTRRKFAHKAVPTRKEIHTHSA